MSPPPPEGAATAASIDAHDLGPSFEPLLLAACDGRLSEIHWFRKPWQRGGAATAFATFRCDDGIERDVIVKLPLHPAEHRLLAALAETGPPIPNVVAIDDELGPYHFAWAVMERVCGEPPVHRPTKAAYLALSDAAALFYERARGTWPLTPPRSSWDWHGLVEQSRERARAGGFELAADWAHELKDHHKLLDRLASEWAGRPINCWLHGDLHLGNLLMRTDDSSWGDAAPMLVDFAEVRCGHWVEDAVYLERTHWAHPESVKGIKPVSMIARARRKLGLETDEEYTRLADVRRALMAAIVPARIDQEGQPAYVEGALTVFRLALTRLM
ncbi:MAG: aminoglycoside phosphotransferase family protein [Planctomycetota bacterium]